MQRFELQIDFFLPVWRRVVLIGICLGAAVFEFILGTPVWGLVFGGMGAYALWQLFFSGWPGDGGGH